MSAQHPKPEPLPESEAVLKILQKNVFCMCREADHVMRQCHSLCQPAVVGCVLLNHFFIVLYSKVFFERD